VEDRDKFDFMLLAPDPDEDTEVSRDELADETGSLKSMAAWAGTVRRG
jgi:hypothetical protein